MYFACSAVCLVTELKYYLLTHLLNYSLTGEFYYFRNCYHNVIGVWWVTNICITVALLLYQCCYIHKWHWPTSRKLMSIQHTAIATVACSDLRSRVTCFTHSKASLAMEWPPSGTRSPWYFRRWLGHSRRCLSSELRCRTVWLVDHGSLPGRRLERTTSTYSTRLEQYIRSTAPSWPH